MSQKPTNTGLFIRYTALVKYQAMFQCPTTGEGNKIDKM